MRRKKVKEPVGVVMRRPLPTDEGTHLLFISRPSSVFAQAGTAIFAVKNVVENHDYMEVDSAYGSISFSKDIPFLMIPRALCTPVSIQDLADIQIQEKKDWTKAYKNMPKDDSEVPAAEEMTPNTGIYL
jgi:hypothetical protein